MSNFIINPQSVSQEQIKKDLNQWLLSQPDSIRWKDFFDSSIGQRVVGLISGLGAFLNYNIIAARRETFIQHAENRASIIAGAETLGYSIFRGRNTILKITLVPNISALLPKFSVIGSVKDKDLVLLEDTVFNAGTPITILAICGDKKEEELTIDTEGSFALRFTNEKVSQDVLVKINGEYVTFAERILELINGKFVVMSNVYGSVNVLYLNDVVSSQYNVGDTVTLEWIELNNISFNNKQVVLDIGSVNTIEIYEAYKEPQTNKSIKINAPLYHETQFIIRGRDDYMKSFRFLDSTIIDTNYKDISPAVVELYYVRDDNSLFSNSELNSFILRLADLRPMGLLPPTIEHPDIVFLDLSIKVSLKKERGNIDTEINTIVSDLENVLKQEIVFEDLENSIESLTTTKIARVTVKPITWLADTYMFRGKHLKVGSVYNRLYEVTDLVYTSGNIEPAWNTLITNSVNDGKLTWCTEERVPCVDNWIPVWQPNTRYKEGDYVIATDGLFPNLKFKVCGYVNKSESSAEVQQINFSAIPTSGTWFIEYGAEKTQDLPFNASAMDIQNALNALNGLESVEVVGNYQDKTFTVIFIGEDANKNHPQFTFNSQGTDEIQCVSFNAIPNMGEWKIEFNGSTTGLLSNAITASELRSALELLPSIGVGNIDVIGSIDPNRKFDLYFKGTLGKKPLPAITIPYNTLITAANIITTPSFITEGIDYLEGLNEKQKLSFSLLPTAGTFSLNFEGATTPILNKDVTASELQNHLESLPSIGVGNISVTGSFSDGFDIEFLNSLSNFNNTTINVATNTLIQSQEITTTFITTQEGGLGHNEIQQLKFSMTPDAGGFRINLDASTNDPANYTPMISYLATADYIKSILGARIGQNVLEVSGNFTNGFVFIFNDNEAHNQLGIAYNDLTKSQNIDAQFTVIQEGREEIVGQNCIQKISFSRVPDSGSFKINDSGSILFSSNASEIQGELEAIFGFGNVSVTGDFSLGFTIEFINSLEKSVIPLLTISESTLSSSTTPIEVTPCMTVTGTYPANNLKIGSDSIMINSVTTTNGFNPEPNWFSGISYC